jgi:site-specific DNA-methyltransferase (adenine-specific)
MARRGIGVIHHGDCIDVMAAMEPESIDAIVTDPPYNLTADTAGWRGKTGDNFNGRPDLALRTTGGFMGKAWDGSGIAFRRETWEAAYRVAKPSAYLLAFGGTRTVHRMTVALEDAGWIIRDMLVWGYASGFPKSKASLKPAWEPIVMARKPGPLRELAIDACRIDERWPANIVLTDSILDGYSRFFMLPKADRSDREPVLGGLPERTAHHTMSGQPIPERMPVARQNIHPTVKPTDLMRHLIRLVTPTGGTVLDPFLGSGTTGLAAEMEGFEWIGIEREAEYVAIAEARLNGTQKGLGLAG